MDAKVWDARKTDIATHTAGDINRLRESLLEDIECIWAEYCAGLMRKSDYHQLAALVPKDKIDHEVAEKLDGIVAVAGQARPRTN